MPAECFDRVNNQCSITADCRLKFALADAVKAFYAELGKYTLADAVSNRKALVKVLFHPPAAKAAAD